MGERMDYLEFIAHLKLTFVGKSPSPPRVACQELVIAAETSARRVLSLPAQVKSEASITKNMDCRLRR
jgi:hypothetical protein